MTRLAVLLGIVALVAGCKCVGPEIIPDSTGDSVIMLSLKEQIEKNSKIDTGYGWVIWYIPVLVMVVAWTWREYVKKPPVCDTCETEKSRAYKAFKKAQNAAVAVPAPTAPAPVEPASEDKPVEPPTP
jgi:hypothetical protein